MPAEPVFQKNYNYQLYPIAVEVGCYYPALSYPSRQKKSKYRGIWK